MRSSSLLVVAASLVTLAACSSSSPRTAFSEEAIEPTEPETPSDTPPETQPSTPVAPTGDASVPDANDGCARTAPSNKCGLAPQCGCASTETCDVVDTSGGVACVVAGKAAMGRPCTTTSGCAQGLTCIGGTCHAFCASAGVACGQPGTGKCLQVKDPSGDVPNLKVCTVTCDLRDPNACGGTTTAGTGACIVDDKGETDCQATTGNVAENGTCSPTADCKPALVCVDITQNGTTSSKCKKWCRVGTADCGTGKTCTGFSTKVLVGGVEHGVCP